MSNPSPEESAHPLRRWAWPLLIGGLVVAGVLLAVADIAVGPKWPSPMAGALYGQGAVKSAPGIPPTQMFRFDRSRLGDRLVFETPIAGFGPLNPYRALQAFLSNGAGLVLLALAALVLFPARARNSVERFEASHGVEVAFGAGLVLVLLTFALVTLLRFTLIFLAVVPFVLGAALIAALFGIACIALGIGRLLARRLRLPPVHPLIAALAGALVVFDLAVIPYAGVFALAAVAIGGLGLAVVTRFGSTGGWSFGDLSW